MNQDTERLISIAVLAVGGQGGGVLSNWLVQLAEANGWRAQNTSVPGVAQRTGATIYYIEMVPESDAVPVLSLMPGPGRVDLCVAAELTEAGRAIQRGLVTPQRTTLIASSHRAYSVAEKSVPGDGATDANGIFSAAESMSQRFLHADMAQLAEQSGSVISASLFGAIAASGELPFPREAFEDTIEQGGLGVESSLAAFALGYDAVAQPAAPAQQPAVERPSLVGGSNSERKQYEALLVRIDNEFPAAAREMLIAGLNAVIDFQDAGYGAQYLERMAGLARLDEANGGAANEHRLTITAAKYLARAMAYDDVIRVADLKTRASRFDRVRRDISADTDQVMQVTEFLHPRLEELCGTLPARLGSALEGSRFGAALRQLTDRGRRVRTDSVFGFTMLTMAAGMRRWRRGSLRHQRESQRLESWLSSVHEQAPRDYALAVEILACQRLLKGYADTHVRGTLKYQKVLAALERLAGREDAAQTVRRLREAALLDEQGDALDAMLAGLESTGSEDRQAVA